MSRYLSCYRKKILLKKAIYMVFLCFTILTISCIGSDTSEGVSNLDKKFFWGDLHNHNAVGYAKGSLGRTYDIASSHLDFFCFTPHSQWPDMEAMPQNAHLHWVNGFKVAKNSWNRVKELADQYNKPGEFVSFLGYEWHSSYCGDVCIIFPDTIGDLSYISDIKEFQAFAKRHGAVLVPHHPAYKTGWRGQDWSVLDTEASPLVEIYSEHGNAESDRAPFPYYRHSMGGRHTPNTVQSLWQQGVEVGVVASTDDHLGYPGAYGEGLACVIADTLTRESIMEAVKARRTYGVSADRIELDFRLNGHYMGESIPSTGTRNITVSVKGKDAVDRVEILKNNQVIYRNHPIDKVPNGNKWDKPVLCRIEFGWGPWGDLEMSRICDWQFNVKVKNGTILSATPCFQSAPLDEERRNELSLGDEGCNVSSYTSRPKAFAEQPTNAIILEIQGSPETILSLGLSSPGNFSMEKSLEELEKSNDILFTGAFTSESLMVHRLVFHDNYATEFSFTDESTQESEETNDWYYARVTQCNGSMAWSSPIWVGSSRK